MELHVAQANLFQIMTLDFDSKPTLNKKCCTDKFRLLTSQRSYRKDWEKELSWLVYDQDVNAFLEHTVCITPLKSILEVFGFQTI